MSKLAMDTLEQQTQDTNQEIESSVNYSEGFHFYFELDGLTIHAHGSAKSGRETIYIDDKLIKQKRSFRRRSVIPFHKGKNHYEIEFYMASMLRGELHCSLIKNGTHVRTQKKALKKHYQVSSVRSIIWSAIIGALSGYGFMVLLLKYLQP